MPGWERGATRLVCLIGPWAIKCPNPATWRSFLYGLLANDQERAFARLQDPRLCPVRLALPGGFVLVMPRVGPLPAGHALPDWSDLPVEFKRDSFGVLAGRIVAIDYGT